MAELTGVRHSETLHDRDRAGVRRNGERHNLVEFSVVEAECDCDPCGFGRIPVTPGRAGEPPADLDARRERGIEGVSKNPTYPINGATLGTSTAHDPKPRSANSGTIRSRTNPSDCARVSGAGKYSITRGSAFNSANGSRSRSNHRRSRTRLPGNSATSPCASSHSGPGVAPHSTISSQTLTRPGSSSMPGPSLRMSP